MTYAIIAATAFVAWVGGALAHELTHYVVSRAFAQEATIDVFRMEVWFETDGIARWEHRAILLAPQTVGGAALLAALAAGVRPSFGLLPAMAGWASYTLMGGLSDLSLRVSNGERPQVVVGELLGVEDLSSSRRDDVLLMLAGLLVMQPGGLILTSTAGTTGELASLGYYVAGPLVVAVGMGMVFASLLRMESQPNATV